MNKFKLNSISICLLPIVTFIPLIYELMKNFHTGGLYIFSEFSISAFIPKINNEILIITLQRVNETLIIAISSWLISILFGVIFGIISSDIFYKVLKLPRIYKRVIKLFLTIIRSVHELIWGLLLMQIYGLDLYIGVVAICLPYIAINSKAISDQINNIKQESYESIIDISGNSLTSLITIISFPIISTLKNFGIYRLECALRSTAILGLFGFGGLGTSIYLAFQALNFRELWTYLWALAILIILLKNILKKIYLIKLNPIIILILLMISSAILIYSIYFLLGLSININFLQFNSIKQLVIFNYDFISKDLYKFILETIMLSFLATGIAISLPPFLFLVFNNQLGFLIIRGISFLIRLIPPSITLLILLMFNEPSIALAALTLGLYNAAIISKLLHTNLDNINKKNYIALISFGTNKRVSWIYGQFSKQIKSYLAYCSYRSDIIIRETAIVGVIGSVGLGWQLQESLSSFAWGEVMIILFSYSSIAIIGEIINVRIKTELT